MPDAVKRAQAFFVLLGDTSPYEAYGPCAKFGAFKKDTVTLYIVQK